ncbi:unnamed protein product [Symbiodinium sp. CCMP2592]|nr:unnamed protein product [Symbiodinium sp. CCMP2592]
MMALSARTTRLWAAPPAWQASSPPFPGSLRTCPLRPTPAVRLSTTVRCVLATSPRSWPTSARSLPWALLHVRTATSARTPSRSSRARRRSPLPGSSSFPREPLRRSRRP